MKISFFIITFLMPVLCYSQIDSSFINKIKGLDTANLLVTDTVAVPNDPLTKKIKLLISEKSGLTIESIIKIKIAEEQKKDTTHSKDFYNKLLNEFTAGRTGQLIENSQINLYRRNFTESEIDELIHFYKTSAGKKVSSDYILMMVQLVKDAEQLLKLAAKNLEGSK